MIYNLIKFITITQNLTLPNILFRGKKKDDEKISRLKGWWEDNCAILGCKFYPKIKRMMKSFIET